MILTQEQRQALHAVYLRHFIHDQTKPALSYREFRRTVQPNALLDCVMVPVPSANLWLGIERDGYTHS